MNKSQTNAIADILYSSKANEKLVWDIGDAIALNNPKFNLARFVSRAVYIEPEVPKLKKVEYHLIHQFRWSNYEDKKIMLEHLEEIGYDVAPLHAYLPNP